MWEKKNIMDKTRKLQKQNEGEREVRKHKKSQKEQQSESINKTEMKYPLKKNHI